MRRTLSLNVTVAAALGVALAASALRAQSPADGAAPKPADMPATSQPAMADKPATMEPRREPTPSDILDLLAPKQGAQRPIVRPNLPGRAQRMSPAPAAMPKNAVVPPNPRLYPDGYRLVDRPGRLVRQGEQWMYAIESRGTEQAELPLRLLPNRMLEDMEIASGGGTESVVFLVSGEVTEYKGVNYLMVQKMLLRPETGNLR